MARASNPLSPHLRSLQRRPQAPHAKSKFLAAYHSEVESDAGVGKWVQVDLGAVMPIDEVRILPARPIDWAQSHGFGFPLRFRVETARQPDFTDPTVICDRDGEIFMNPGDNPLVIPLDDCRARIVRFTATQLWQRESDFVLALAELQVFAGGENVALGAEVSASDSIAQGLWNKDYLVDGFDSQQQIVDDELGWLRGIVRRHQLTTESAAAEQVLDTEVRRVIARLVWLASATGIGLSACLGLVFLRGRAARKRETDRLRERIASDLHDEIGSNLGSIALLSQIGGEGAEFAEINRVALETAASMQDIAWVVRSGHDNLQDFVLRMREVAAAMLKTVDFTFAISPAEIPDRRISLDFKRNFLLFFKESLHNLTRHSHATEATIQMAFDRREVRLHIRDNGCGFDASPRAQHPGSGLKNMRRRGQSLGGEVSITSDPDAGTEVGLRAPYS